MVILTLEKIYKFFIFFNFIFCCLGPYSRHMVVPSLGVKSGSIVLEKSRRLTFLSFEDQVEQDRMLRTSGEWKKGQHEEFA